MAAAPTATSTSTPCGRRCPTSTSASSTGSARRSAWDQLRSVGSGRSWSFGRYAVPRCATRSSGSHHPRRRHRARRRSRCRARPARSFRPSGLVAGRLLLAQRRIADRRRRRRCVPGGRRLFAVNDARKLRREERAVWNSVDLVLAVSEHDADVMRRQTLVEVELCPNGTDPVEPTPLVPPDPDEPVRLLFVGSGSYAPYERGLAWFGREVMPEVRRRRRVEFDVVGRPPRRAPTAPEIVHRAASRTWAPGTPAPMPSSCRCSRVRARGSNWWRRLPTADRSSRRRSAHRACLSSPTSTICAPRHRPTSSRRSTGSPNGSVATEDLVRARTRCGGTAHVVQHHGPDDRGYREALDRRRQVAP
jgi:hypothetical protein